MTYAHRKRQVAIRSHALNFTFYAISSSWDPSGQREAKYHSPDYTLDLVQAGREVQQSQSLHFRDHLHHWIETET